MSQTSGESGCDPSAYRFSISLSTIEYWPVLDGASNPPRRREVPQRAGMLTCKMLLDAILYKSNGIYRTTFEAVTLSHQVDEGPGAQLAGGGSPLHSPESALRDLVDDEQELGAVDSKLSAVDSVLGVGEPLRVGRFRFFVEDQCWEWSAAVARMHGYEPETVKPTTELLLRHAHPEDRERPPPVLDSVIQGRPFSIRHRIIDTSGHIRYLVVAGDQMLDHAGALIGTSGFYIDVTDFLHSEIADVLQAVADARACIEQAKGVLIGTYGVTAERAFEILAWRSHETNLKVRELAVRFLDTLGNGASAETRSQVARCLLSVS